MKYLTHTLLILISFTLIISCSNEEINEEIIEESEEEITDPYFPSAGTWENLEISDLNWNESAVEDLLTFVESQGSKSFMILKEGKIVIEEYFNGHNSDDYWQWNSAGKTLTTAAIQLAQQQGFLNIEEPASNYLDVGWTNMSEDKEGLITIKDLLSMTSGIDDSKQLVIRSNLNYVADAGTRWAYGNVFQKLMDIVSEATSEEFETYLQRELLDPVGMNGSWNNGLIFTIFSSDTRSMARFGILASNNGFWKNQSIINEDLFLQAIRPSQNINPSYGFLWWLNGESQFMLPGSQEVFNGPLVPNAPEDMYAAMGANEQRLYIVPSQDLIVIRMGEATETQNENFALSSFDDALWEKINALTK